MLPAGEAGGIAGGVGAGPGTGGLFPPNKLVTPDIADFPMLMSDFPTLRIDPPIPASPLDI